MKNEWLQARSTLIIMLHVHLCWFFLIQILDMLESFEKGMSQMQNVDPAQYMPNKPIGKTTTKTEVKTPRANCFQKKNRRWFDTCIYTHI